MKTLQSQIGRQFLIHRRRLLLLMHVVLNNKALYPPFNLRLNNRPSRRGGLHFEIPRVKYKVGKESAQCRGPVIWNFVNRFINFNANVQKDRFKNILFYLQSCILIAIAHRSTVIEKRNQP